MAFDWGSLHSHSFFFFFRFLFPFFFHLSAPWAGHAPLRALRSRSAALGSTCCSGRSWATRG